jgi:hypothetical protein
MFTIEPPPDSLISGAQVWMPRRVPVTLISKILFHSSISDHRDLRAALIGAQLSGLLLMRYLFKVSPLAAADPTVLISAVAPTIQLYLTGDLIGMVDPTAKSSRRSRKPSR